MSSAVPNSNSREAAKQKIAVGRDPMVGVNAVYNSNRGLLLRFGVKWPAEGLVQSDETGRFRRRTNNSSLCPCQYQHLVRTSAVTCLERRLWPLPSSRWPCTPSTPPSTPLTFPTPP